MRILRGVIILEVLAFMLSCVFLGPVMGAIGHMGIAGAVYNADTLEGISGAVVHVEAEGFSESVPTDTHGSYSVSGCPTDQEIIITCRKAGYAPYRAVIPLISPETTIANYVHHIYLQGFSEGDAVYGVDETSVIYIMDDDTKVDIEREYTPQVDPAVFNERPEEAAKENQTAQ